jgi:CBS domain-containing protein
MTQTLQEVMTRELQTCPPSTTLADAARYMRDQSVGDVLVEQDGRLVGIVTDRDIVVRAIAEGADPNASPIGDICSQDLTTLSPNDTVDDALRVMREKSLRRLPVSENGQPVGIVSLGDLAIEGNAESALEDISSAAPND